MTRVIFLGLTIYLFFYLILNTSWYATTFIVGAVTVYQIYGLISYVEKTNRDLTRFLQAIKHTDFTQTFTGLGLGTNFNELKSAFNEVLNAFRKTRSEKEENYQYLQTVVQHVGIGLIAFTPDGEVELINAAAKRNLKEIRITNINQLRQKDETLVDELLNLSSGRKSLVKVRDDNEMLQLAIYATELVLQGRRLKLVSIQNIQSELEEQEMEAWQKLIRVLTHEIMNSVTPISSLAATANSLLQKQESVQSSSEDVKLALETIEKRSQGLLHFIDNYRNLTKVPKPKFKIFTVQSLFASIQQLMQVQLDEQRVAYYSRVDPSDLQLAADPEMIEQVIINLIINAIHATSEKPRPKIELKAWVDRLNRVLIQVEDNGKGIVKEVQEQIFIPFFTTKEQGSGIGLSLSRQIMRMHRGTISVASEPGKTVFTLKF